VIYSVKVTRLRAHGSLSGALAGSGNWLVGDAELGTGLKSRRPPYEHRIAAMRRYWNAVADWL
jgi:hypothetical protein